MPISATMLPEYDQEMSNTRKTLERVPDGKFDWKPHDKSMKMGSLAQHLATIPQWGQMTIATDSLDLAPGGVPVPQPAPVKTSAELLDMFDKNAAAGRAALAGVSDADLMKPWSLLMNGNALFTMPRLACLRGFVMNHMIHHRAQLGVYLRLNDVPVPALYGPSADEGGF